MRYYVQIIILNVHLLCIAQPFTIMIEPAGNALHPGRIIGDSYERGVSLQCAQAIKNNLEAQHHIQCIIARTNHEESPDVEVAQYANRLNIDLFISLNFFYKSDEKPHIYLYYFLLNPMTDFWTSSSNDFSFIEYNQAHRKNISLSKKYIEFFYDHLKKLLAKHILIDQPYGIPFKSLAGISAPAFAIEALITHTQSWQAYIPYLSDSLSSLINLVHNHVS